MSRDQRPFAVFDLDGTLIRWQLYHALADELVKDGHFDAKQYELVREARMNWKKRANEESFEKYEVLLVKVVDGALTGMRITDFERACRNVMSEYQDQVYTYTRDLIRDLKQDNYLVFAISASPDQIVGMAAEYYGFDDYRGSVYGSENGVISSQRDILKRDRKVANLQELATKHQAGWQASIAVGDSESDIPMLEAVERPIAFNPTRQLFDYAKTQGWKIVVERKNVIYELESGDGSYLLA